MSPLGLRIPDFESSKEVYILPLITSSSVLIDFPLGQRHHPSLFGPISVLVPANRLDKQTFDRIARRMQENPNWNRVARRYMVVNSQKEHLAANDNNGQQSSGSKQKAVKSHWTGYYRVNFSNTTTKSRDWLACWRWSIQERI